MAAAASSSVATSLGPSALAGKTPSTFAGQTPFPKIRVGNYNIGAKQAANFMKGDGQKGFLRAANADLQYLENLGSSIVAVEGFLRVCVFPECDSVYN